MHVQDSHWSSASTIAPGGGAMGGAIGSAMSAAAGTNGRGDSARTTPLRGDAQRNLEHVLRAAREGFGELGYGAPMEGVARRGRGGGGAGVGELGYGARREDVARRARVGVGTVYRRFPSKDVLVRRIAEEE